MKRLVAILALSALYSVSAGAQVQRDSAGNVQIDRVVAVVGAHAILWSDLVEAINQRRASGLTLPEDSAGQAKVSREVLDQMIDEEVLVQRARTDTSVVVVDADIQNTVDAEMKRIRAQFKSDGEMVQALKNAGFGNPEEYRRGVAEQVRRRALQERLIGKLKQSGKMIPVAVTEDDVSKAFTESAASLPKRPPQVTFRQLIVPTVATDTAMGTARAKAESLLVEIRAGGDFESIAKRESEDPVSKETGGDLGWNRRGQMVPTFDRVMFALGPGQVGPVVETQYGYHIIRVDRIQPAEVKARHILIKPAFDSADMGRARLRADSALTLWKAGTPFDTLVARYHDVESDEAKGVLEPFNRTQLPESYQKAFEGKGANDFVEPFPIEDKQRGVPKYVVAQILSATEGGDYTVADLRNVIREQLAQERSYRRLLDTLKRETYVAVKL